MKILESKLKHMNPIELLIHTLVMFGLGVVWLSTVGILITNPKILPGLFWEVGMYLLYLTQNGEPRFGTPENITEFGDLFTVWGIISRYWWLSLAPTLSLTYFILTRKK